MHQFKILRMFCYIKYVYKILSIYKRNILQYKYALYIYIFNVSMYVYICTYAPSPSNLDRNIWIAFYLLPATPLCIGWIYTVLTIYSGIFSRKYLGDHCYSFNSTLTTILKLVVYSPSLCDYNRIFWFTYLQNGSRKIRRCFSLKYLQWSNTKIKTNSLKICGDREKN